MQFSSAVHGSNIVIEDSGRSATRKNEFSFCNGLVFSQCPLQANRPVSLRIKSSDIKWRGSVSIGLTDSNPAALAAQKCLPKFLQSLPEEDVHFVHRMSNSSWGDCRLVIVMSSNNDLVLTVNNEPPQIFLKGLPPTTTDKTVWLVLDLFGRTTCVSIVEFDESNSRLPTDWLSLLGPQTASLYKMACKEASVPFNSGRVFFIGPFNAGKSAVKRALVGLSTDDANRSGPLDASFVSASNKLGDWYLTSTLDTSHESHAGGNNASHGDDLAALIAFNVTREVEFKSDLIEVSTTCAPSGLVKTALGIQSRKHEYSAGDINPWLECLPGNLRKAVQTLLADENKSWFADDNGSTSIRNQFKCKYSLWDFSGDTLYFLAHQALFSPHALYVLVIDISEHLNTPLASSHDHVIQAETRKSDLTTLNMVHHWLAAINSLVGKHQCLDNFNDNGQSDEKAAKLSSSPKVIIVGTHRNSVHVEPITRDLVVGETIERIRQSLEGKVYKDLVHPRIFALDCNQMSYDEPTLLNQLRISIDQSVQESNLLGYEVPLSWLSFEFIVKKLQNRKIYFVDCGQLYEVARSQFEVFYSSELFRAMLHFHHIQGKILLLGHHLTTEFHGFSCDDIVILDPIWFASRLYELCDAVRITDIGENVDCKQGMLREEVINHVWSQWLDQKNVLLGCIEKLDLICELRPYLGADEPPDVAASAMQQPKLYFFPWITQLLPESYGYASSSDASNPLVESLRLAIDFKGLLPIGLFSRLVVRLGRWSWAQGWGRRPEVCHGEARIGVDFDHDMVLRINVSEHRIDVIIAKIYESIHGEETEATGPTSNICVKVRHLLETELEHIRKTYYSRVSSCLVVKCPCNLVCETHQVAACDHESCEHFVSLDECLSKKVIECDYRQVKTSFVQRYFPQAHFGRASPAGQGFDSFPEGTIFDLVNGWEQIFHVEPSWMRDAAKLLGSHSPGHDWTALAKRLGYNDRDTNRLVEDVNPSLALLRDWHESNGRTKYSIDVLLSCLRMLSREDVRCVIELELEPEGSAPPIFISYQWDTQELVLELRRKLELAGFPCWMDVGLMGGGDSLYGKIYDGISRAKVVLCCLSPRYAASRICAREITLADVLHKPILPILIEPTPWPPPGPLAVIMSSLVYVDLCGVGGHGGIGKRGDSESRFRDILDRISRYIAGFIDAPMATRHSQLPDIFSGDTLGGRVTPSTMMAGLVSGRSGGAVANVSPSPPRTQSERDGRESGGAEGGQSASHAPQEAREEELANFRPLDVISEDSLSVMSRIHAPHANAANRISNSITNCSICSIL